MGRPFGYDASAVMVAFNLDGTFKRAAAAVAEVWDSISGGTQITDLITWNGDFADTSGTPITEVVADGNGQLGFRCVDPNIADVWLDFGLGVRQHLMAADTAMLYDALFTEAWRTGDHQNDHLIVDPNKSAFTIQAAPGQVADVFVLRNSAGVRTGYGNEEGLLRARGGQDNDVVFRVIQRSNTHAANLQEWTKSNDDKLSWIENDGTHVDPTLFRRKTADEPLPTSTALQDDNHLIVPVKVDGIYRIETFLIVDGPAAADLKLGWSAPSGSTLHWTSAGLTTSLGAGAQSASYKLPYLGLADTDGVGLADVGTKVIARPSGLLLVGASAGNLTLRWAELTSSGTVTVYAGSWIQLTKVA